MTSPIQFLLDNEAIGDFLAGNEPAQEAWETAAAQPRDDGLGGFPPITYAIAPTVKLQSRQSIKPLDALANLINAAKPVSQDEIDKLELDGLDEKARAYAI